MAGTFAQVINVPDSCLNLAEAAVRIGEAADPALDVPARLTALDRLATEAPAMLKAPVLGTRPRRLLETLSAYLFQKQGFRGDREDYYNPRNSYLHEVLDRRIGIPITLAVVYLEVGWRLELPLAGIGLPAHFMVGWTGPGEPLFVDVFNGGDVLDRDGCQDRLDDLLGRTTPLQDTWLEPAPRRAILTRILNNLKSACLRRGFVDRAIDAVEKLLLLDPDNASEERDLGILYSHSGHRWQALSHLERYLALRPDATDAPAVRAITESLFGQLSGSG